MAALDRQPGLSSGGWAGGGWAGGGWAGGGWAGATKESAASARFLRR